MAGQQPQKGQGLPNPYGSMLPNPYAGATISAAPVKYTEEQVKAQQQKITPAFHNPHAIKRPQAKNQTKKPGNMINKGVMPAARPLFSSGAGPATQQHGIEYYLSTADDDAAIIEERRQRNYEEKQRKKEQKKFTRQYGQWNPQAPHKPSTPSNLAAYRASGGYRRKKEAFSAFLRGASEQQRSRDDSDASNSPRPLSSDSSKPGATISAPPVLYAGATISGPPVHYERPALQMQGGGAEPMEDERPAKRVKTLSKAEKMMEKMGYKKGQGLGKNNDGVIQHLEVKMRKAPQGGTIFDDDNGKVKAQQVWDVRGGERAQKDEPGKFGEESSVVVAWGCVDGVDWTANADRNDGGIRQEMGEAFGNKFGPVTKVQLDESSKDGAVYIQFSSVLSALNAVNRFDEGWEFRGRKIRAKYYDERKFLAGVYDH
ncbi:G-patch DNA repair protein [Pyrenophora tritici-repentis]|nr:G-patch DNA repair protein [Pyrenophora tritici-repentis]KAI0579493.1 G-patch DNA repair protein [Pyrenophora tritici-repentis]KAI0579945.1 G-patch DNA repair protein [Pyrenophora tritici-repentis]KAI0608145.1 G-patch DNA repair protein [Pyrenophora tritici-repentis]KAI0619565.1 G-patch DNA repair protein [Pyrenophora tritici-repentis]